MTARVIVGLAATLATLLFASLVWWILKPVPTSTWIRIERGSWEGAFLPVRACWTTPHAGYVVVDLHGADAQAAMQGYLAQPLVRAVSAGSGCADMTVKLPEGRKPAWVFLVAYFGPSHRWEDHGLSATTALLKPGVNGSLGPLAWVTHDPHTTAPAVPPNSLLESVTGLGFFAAAIVLQRSSRRGTARLRTGGLVGACLVAAAIAGLGGTEIATSTVRSISEAWQVYAVREPLQRLMILGIAAVALGTVLVALCSDLRAGLLAAGVLGYVGLAAIQAVSLHAVDEILNGAWWELRAFDIIGLGCAAMALTGAGMMRVCPSPVTQ